jgi:hypothetical protein
MSLTLLKPPAPKRFKLRAWARETIERGIADESLPAPRPAPAWMIAEDKHLRALVRALFRSSPCYMAGHNNRPAPRDVELLLEMTVSYGLAEALDIMECARGGCVPIELAGCLIVELVTASGMYFTRETTRTANASNRPPVGAS